MTYTLGPWRINPKASMVVESESGRTIANCGGYASNTENTEPENQANARLIAAAPDLLEALQAAIPHLEYICDHNKNLSKGILSELDERDLALARAAIAKAGGPK